MAHGDIADQFKKFEIPGRLSFLEGNGELPSLEVLTPQSEAELYLHGAHLTHFQKKDEEPLLFLSRFSRFAPAQAIRGGVPVIFPWFGAREGEPMHGFARIEDWRLQEVSTTPKEGVVLRLRLPDCAEAASFPPFTADYVVTVEDTLSMELIITNHSPDADFVFEMCLHSYFAVGDIHQVTVTGLKGVKYLDKVENFAARTEAADAIQFRGEVDRVYLDTPSAVEIHDPTLRRVIRIDKSGSASTVVWNPWMAKAQQMPDFGSDEYQRMLCVESGNVANNRLTLRPGRSATMLVKVSSHSQ